MHFVTKPTAATKSSLKDHAIAQRVLARLSALFGDAFVRQWSSVQPEYMQQVWSESLRGYTPDEIIRGLSACARQQYAPTIPEFLLLCRPNLDAEAAFREACLQLSLRDQDQDTWSHPAVYWAALDCGTYDVLHSSWPQIKTRWTAALQKNLANLSLPPVPQRLRELPAPRMTREQLLNLQAQMKAILNKRAATA